MTDAENNLFICHPLASDAGKRLDVFLAEQLNDRSRSRIKRLIEEGDVTVNGRQVKPSYKVSYNETVEIDLSNDSPVSSFEPEDIPLEILFEDEYLAIINKPAGMVVHPGAGNQTGTLANAIAWHFRLQKPGREQGLNAQDPSIALDDARASETSDRVGIVHRLDKDTSGLIVVAKDEQTHEALAEQFRSRTVEKCYVALVHGSPDQNSGTIDRPIARDRWHRTKMTVAANGRYAISHWKVRQRFEKFTLLEVDIKTGRTHQIRVHLASINHPVVGDATYNEGRDNTIANQEIKKAVERLNRFFLHAEKLTFTHPQTGEYMSFTSEIPEELTQLLKML
ncbi:RluA family pseudouridine synthase [Leptolyngbya sp. 7M]|uniref:RluA family pseudouridine synthase n=1 Tax=Leptolyngbya sp. 7M TaxID=2812896 RepID=UPI001B8C844A|nr:RluA family pseudouridine synthase [Leptolyngbya sp. 7M]QYO62026.1 RluA family pseudouridine synthase [Leptolyngbya sp. 7M]